MCYICDIYTCSDVIWQTYFLIPSTQILRNRISNRRCKKIAKLWLIRIAQSINLGYKIKPISLVQKDSTQYPTRQDCPLNVILIKVALNTSWNTNGLRYPKSVAMSLILTLKPSLVGSLQRSPYLHERLNITKYLSQ